VLEELTLTAVGGTTLSTKDTPLIAEAYAVGLVILPGFSHEVLVLLLPWFGPRNCPVEDTAFALKLFTVNMGPLTTAARKVLRVAASMYTTCPFSTEREPRKPANVNPSLIVGSGPLY
jgi:hypothetical protein